MSVAVRPPVSELCVDNRHGSQRGKAGWGLVLSLLAFIVSFSSPNPDGGEWGGGSAALMVMGKKEPN